jgi:hypothetical protein
MVLPFDVGAQAMSDQIVTVEDQAVSVNAVGRFIVIIRAEVKDGYHIQANKLRSEYLIPTTLEITGGDQFILKKIGFPRAKKFKLHGTDTFLDVYDGKIEIKTFFKIEKQPTKGIYNLDGKLSYQACDSVRCLFPRNIKFLITAEVK